MNWQSGTQRTPTSKDDDDAEKAEAAPAQIAKQLLDSRTVLLTGPVTDELSQKIMAQLLVLDAKDCEKPIRVYINSPGGSVDAGFAIYDSMRFVKSPVHAVCAGLAASAATVILLGADKGRRYSLPNTRFLLHQPSTGMQGQASDIAIGAQQILKLRKRINELLVEETGQTLERIQTDTHRDHWMTADEAVTYGLIDSVVSSAGDLD
jgi:ATP-dependent Clp protease protease subunit